MERYCEMSKYKEVYKNIKKQIKDGKLKSKDYLKSEADLAIDYSCSVLTVRKALALLESEGYIQKIKGKKSIVLEKGDLKNISLTSIQTFQELNKIKNIDVKANLVSLYIVQGVEELMKKFNVSKTADFYKVVRTYSLDGETVQYATSYFDRKIVTYLNDEIASKSIYEYLENELNLKISYSRREIKFRSATDEERRYINLENIDRVVVIETYAYLSNGNLFQYETITYHPDKFTFTAIAKR